MFRSVDFVCEPCVKTFEEIVPNGTEAMECPKCGKLAPKQAFVTTRNYSIKGDNSASITPKGKGKLS